RRPPWLSHHLRLAVGLNAAFGLPLLPGGLGLPLPGLLPGRLCGRSRAGREPLPHPGDAAESEPERGEPTVAQVIQTAAGIGIVLVAQTRIDASAEADELGRAVAFRSGRRVDIVARFNPGSQCVGLSAQYILEVENRADLHDDRLTAAVEVSHLQTHPPAVSSDDDPLGQGRPHLRTE